MVKNRLNEIRHELKLNTQKQMAELLGIRPEQYNRYERQITQPTLEVALQIAHNLNRPVESIFYQEPK